MSHVIHCDGNCGFHSKNVEDFEKIGTVYGNEYCADCSELAHTYLCDVDTLQEKFQVRWKKEFATLKRQHQILMAEGGILPNEL